MGHCGNDPSPTLQYSTTPVPYPPAFPAGGASRHVTLLPSCQPSACRPESQPSPARHHGWPCRHRSSRITSEWSSASAPTATCFRGDLTSAGQRQFAFVTAVRARDWTSPTRRENFFPPDKPIYLLGEIIHNPEVNDQIRNMWHQDYLRPKPTEAELAQLAGRRRGPSFPPSARKSPPANGSRKGLRAGGTPPAAT